MTGIDTTPRSGADTFTRNAMVASAFIAPLAIAVSLFLGPSASTATGEAYVKGIIDNIGNYPLWSWLGAISAIFLIPGIFAISKVARRAQPTFGLVGMILAFTMAMPTPDLGDDLIYVAHKNGVEAPTIAKMLETELPTSLLDMVFFLGLIGLILLGVAALLGKTAPTWAAITLIVAPVLVPIPWLAGMSTIIAASAWVVLAVGMGGVALGLLREQPSS